jgi:AraC-like DNA-binding protein
MAPRHWLQEKRLSEALHLIEKKQESLLLFILISVFESLAHFSTSFKKKYGKAPNEWLN